MCICVCIDVCVCVLMCPCVCVCELSGGHLAVELVLCGAEAEQVLGDLRALRLEGVFLPTWAALNGELTPLRKSDSTVSQSQLFSA